MCEEGVMIYQQSGRWKAGRAYLERWGFHTWEGAQALSPIPDVFSYESWYPTYPAFLPGHRNGAPSALFVLISFLHLKTLPAPPPHQKKRWMPCDVVGHCFQGGHMELWALVSLTDQYYVQAFIECQLCACTCVSGCLQMPIWFLHFMQLSISQGRNQYLEIGPVSQEPCLHSNRGLKLQSKP